MSDEIYEKIEQIMKENNHSVKGIHKDANLRKDVELDSLDTINFFFEMERAFGVTISEADIRENNLLSIKELIEYINKKIN